MAIAQDQLIEYNDLQTVYTTFNTFISTFGGPITTLTIPPQAKVEDTDVNNLNTKIDEFKSDEYLSTQSSWWVNASVTAGDLAEALDWAGIHTTIDNFSRVKCRNQGTYQNTNHSNTCSDGIRSVSCGHTNRNHNCSDGPNSVSCSNGNRNHNCSNGANSVSCSNGNRNHNCSNGANSVSCTNVTKNNTCLNGNHSNTCSEGTRTVSVTYTGQILGLTNPMVNVYYRMRDGSSIPGELTPCRYLAYTTPQSPIDGFCFIGWAGTSFTGSCNFSSYSVTDKLTCSVGSVVNKTLYCDIEPRYWVSIRSRPTYSIRPTELRHDMENVLGFHQNTSLLNMMTKSASCTYGPNSVSCSNGPRSVGCNPNGSHNNTCSQGTRNVGCNPNGTHSNTCSQGTRNVTCNPNGQHGNTCSQGTRNVTCNPNGTHSNNCSDGPNSVSCSYTTKGHQTFIDITCIHQTRNGQ